MNFLTAWGLGEALKYSLLGSLKRGPEKGGLLIAHTPRTLTTSRNDCCFLNSCDVLSHPGTNVLSEDSISIQHEHRGILSCGIRASVLRMVSKGHSYSPCPAPLTLRLPGTPGPETLDLSGPANPSWLQEALWKL